MNIKILKTELKNLNMFNNNTFEFDFICEKRVYQEEKESNIVSSLFNNFYELNAISIIGINASGKTISLNILGDVLKIYIGNSSLTEIFNLNFLFEDELVIKNVLKDDENLYEIISYIQKDDFGQLYFKEETLKKVKIQNNITRNTIDTIFDSVEAVKRSNLKNEFLKKEDSIFSAVLNKAKSPFISNLSTLTNLNIPVYSQFVELPFIQYLDPSIERFDKIQPNNKTESIEYRLKFMGDKKELVLDQEGLERYLSSGTIKGINILVAAKQVLKSGGYLLIDEFENHLNKTLVINLISLFTSELNIHGASIIFTTHYVEILDALTRTDGIYIAEKKEKISLTKYSKKAVSKDRLDKKKSDLILSGQISQTPSYKSYISLKRNLKEYLIEE